MSNCKYEDFDPNIDYQLRVGTTAVFNNKLWYFTPGRNSEKINWATYDMSNLSQLDVTAGWESEEMPAIRNEQTPRTNARPAAVVTNSQLYFFWNESKHNHGIWAAALDATGTWSDKAIKILSPHLSGHFEEGKAINPKEYIYLTAYCYGGDIVLAWTSDSKKFIYHMLLCVDDIDTDKQKWQGRQAVVHKFSTIGVGGYGSKISMAWFSQVKDDKPSEWMICGFYDTKDNRFRSFALSLDENGLPTMDNSVVFDSHKASHGVSITRDPGGRILAYYATSGGHLEFRALNTFEDLTSNSWGDKVKLNGKDTETHDIPVPAYLFGASSACTYTDGKGDLPATCYPVYEIVMYGASDEKDDAHKIRGQVAQYGMIKVVPNYASRQLFRKKGFKKENGTHNPTLLVIDGIIDGPIPIPQENTALAFRGKPIGTVTYGATETGTSGHTVSQQLVSGLRTSGGFTNGVGPAWDLAFKEGLGEVVNETTTNIYEVPLVGTTVVNSDANNNPIVQNTGILFTEAVTLVEEPYFFFDCRGKQISAKSAPEYGVIKSVPSLKLVNYDVFSTAPGNLLSYTKDAINAQMKSLYDTYKSNLKTGHTDVFGSGYKNYIDEVVLPQAFELANGQNYLEFAWSNSGNVEPTWQVINTSMVERSWTIDGSLYSGISGGVGADFFGVGKKASFQALTGIEFSYSTVTKESNSEAWGIAADLSGLPSGSNPGEVSSYTWRLYFLPENRLWGDEIRYLSPSVSVQDSVDPNSSPWKVMFLVDEETITYQAATITITKAVFVNGKLKIQATTTDLTGTANLTAVESSQNIILPLTYKGNGEYVINKKWNKSDPPQNVTVSSFKGSSASMAVTIK